MGHHCCCLPVGKHHHSVLPAEGVLLAARPRRAPCEPGRPDGPAAPSLFVLSHNTSLWEPKYLVQAWILVPGLHHHQGPGKGAASSFPLALAQYLHVAQRNLMRSGMVAMGYLPENTPCFTINSWGSGAMAHWYKTQAAVSWSKQCTPILAAPLKYRGQFGLWWDSNFWFLIPVVF